MFTSLRHRTICSTNHKNGSIHLCSTSNHILDIVGVPRTVNVSIVTIFSLILNMRCLDSNPSFSFLRCIINSIKRTHFRHSQSTLGLRNCCSQRCFSMINVTNSTNITVRLISFKFAFSHFSLLIYK